MLEFASGNLEAIPEKKAKKLDFANKNYKNWRFNRNFF